MKIAIVSSKYPSEQNHYSHTFVHTRNKQYLKSGIPVDVFVPSKTSTKYNYQGIDVYLGNPNLIVTELKKYDVVLIHLLDCSINEYNDGSIIYNFLVRSNKKTLFFLHGIDTLQLTKYRTHEIELNPKSLLMTLYRDFYQFYKNKKLITAFNKTPNCHFIFPSEWLKKESETSFQIEYSNSSIIPNGIDTELFKYNNNLWENRYKLLTIRPINKKYAIEYNLKLLALIDPEFLMTIYGKGVFLDNITSSNLILYKSFIPNNLIPNIHKENGIYLASTKMDTQGVSACEAMSSGLPTISYNVGGVSEFIDHNKSGFLIDNGNYKQNIRIINELASDKNLFQTISENGRMKMEEIDIKKTTANELNIIFTEI